MKRIITRALAFGVLMLGCTQVSYGLFRGIFNTAETAVGGAVNVAEDAVGVVGDTAATAVGAGGYDADRGYDRIRDRRVDYNQRRDQLMNDTTNNY